MISQQIQEVLFSLKSRCLAGVCCNNKVTARCFLPYCLPCPGEEGTLQTLSAPFFVHVPFPSNGKMCSDFQRTRSPTRNGNLVLTRQPLAVDTGPTCAAVLRRGVPRSLQFTGTSCFLAGLNAAYNAGNFKVQASGSDKFGCYLLLLEKKANVSKHG